jgi:predicted DNA-binding antitoxin AbrB/MazE fold protein
MDPLNGTLVFMGSSGTTIAQPPEFLITRMPWARSSRAQGCSERALMSKPIESIYENGVLRPLKPLDLEEHQRVTITIAEDAKRREDLLDPEFTQWCAEQSRNAPSLEEVCKTLSKIRGSMADVVIAEPDER